MGYEEAHDEKLFNNPEVVSLRKKLNRFQVRNWLLLDQKGNLK